MSSGLPNPWVYLTETFWELYSVILGEELPNRNGFGITSVIYLCVMVFIPVIRAAWISEKEGAYQVKDFMLAFEDQ